MAQSNIFVTQPFLPPLEEFVPYLEAIWQRKVLTNNGPFHQQLEAELASYLGVEHISLFNNGTNALVTALQALDIHGEVITTPYSFVATSHALLWNNINPVFVDIDPVSLNIDPARIEAAITPRTQAILAVHCYGTPCDVEAIEVIARRHGLKVIYDAAHAFAVDFKGRSLLQHGDLSVLSFHATKVFNTFEGGAIISPDAQTKRYVDQLKNFGFVNETTVVAAGINGKMSEINAAFGLLQLKHVDQALDRRRQIETRYREALARVPGIAMQPRPADTRTNASYFPVFVGSPYPLGRDALYECMRQHGIFGRRYFYPLISDMPMYRDMPSASPDNLPVARRVADSVICLPIYPALPDGDVDRVIGLIASPETPVEPA
ncbi:MAG: DegT/DnrJ/EryC1/StrS family aminotransferase [Burkholderiaceae bacterium]